MPGGQRQQFAAVLKAVVRDHGVQNSGRKIRHGAREMWIVGDADEDIVACAVLRHGSAMIPTPGRRQVYTCNRSCEILSREGTHRPCGSLPPSRLRFPSNSTARRQPASLLPGVGPDDRESGSDPKRSTCPSGSSTCISSAQGRSWGVTNLRAPRASIPRTVPARPRRQSTPTCPDITALHDRDRCLLCRD